ncbi:MULTISPECIES: hypothetical protein [Cyanophyceae]|uniref:hypothetical protein n=1 Tax=Cyanophyceae TaxID=3028117 RepID=UPI001683CB43|nr:MULTISPECIES: hypothetical protein [Cyanophyceae]MBD1916254.1 hypothetical protein [Phormidium sp. FACHB-77]MBD2031477.1 hypothetical protein [Phormidium sp. FACHB-322]MBD2052896.1 hypothetical protein [Leptolyngbya sp. FACHB-60]
MQNQDIIQLLSHHRVPGRLHLPQALTCYQLLGLLRATVPPSALANALSPSRLDQALHNLEAQGEVLLGVGKRVCMAQPTVYTSDEESVTGIQFLGDRAYLRLAHQALQTGQPVTQTLLRPKNKRLEWIQTQLGASNIGCHTPDQLVSQLPTPQLPANWQLREQHRSDNPFFTYQGFESILGYRPEPGRQCDRWQPIIGLEHLGSIASLRLLKTPEGEFLWFQDGQFFGITPDTAYLAMFELDLQINQPLQIALDEKPGLLDLRDTFFPKAYAQLIWRLSKPSPDHNRIRYVDAQNQPRVKAALERLGCVLV